MLTTCSTMRLLDPQKSRRAEAASADMRLVANGSYAVQRVEQWTGATFKVAQPVLR